MTDSRLASSFVQARLYRVNPGRPLRVIVLHDMEAPEGPRTAENCATYFAGPDAATCSLASQSGLRKRPGPSCS